MSKTIYFDASCGVSGDMFVGALLDLGADFEQIKADVYSLGLEVELTAETVIKQGIRAVKFSVLDKRTRRPAETVQGHHEHRHLKDIRHLIQTSALDQAVKDNALSIFERIAAAEAHVHGSTAEAVHFHEVGAADSIADIVAAAGAFYRLGAIGSSSEINVGGGTVTCRHGVLPVPAPAVAELLKGLPAYSDGTKSELATPTGVALLKHFCGHFGSMPRMIIIQTGYGAGTREIDRPNILRAVLGKPVNG